MNLSAKEADGSGVGENVRSTGRTLYKIYDDFLPRERREEIFDYVSDPGWEFGWRSNALRPNATARERLGPPYRFLHKHYAGTRRIDHLDPQSQTILDRGQDCEEELKTNHPIVWCFWDDLKNLLLKNHTLVRCYANGMSYGVDGTLHTDSVVSSSFTCLYYPHGEWYPDWAGETSFFNREKTDLVGSVYPKPGRLVIFPGTVPHVARSVSRTCPVLRITLMFKTEIKETELKA